MAELIDIANAMFKNKSEWINITSEDKVKFSFIFNRYFSKRYPKEAQLLNLKLQDRSSIMDLWYYFNLDKPYPKWFWSKTSKKNSIIEERDFNLLINKLELNKKEDLYFLIKNYPDIIKEELKYFKTKNK